MVVSFGGRTFGRRRRSAIDEKFRTSGASRRDELTDLPHHFDSRSRTVRAIIETPRGSRQKFTYGPKLEAFVLKKLLPAGMTFPLDFGFIPSTRGEDGDPLDLLVVTDEPLPIGAVLRVRLVGVLEATQHEHRSAMRKDRLIDVACESTAHAKVRALTDLGAAFAREIELFWTTYNALRDRRFDVIGWRGAAQAAMLIRASRR
jgi:inorganic pyrophosphatase